MRDDALSRLLDLRSDPYSYARAYKERTGGKVMGYFCCYAPEEMIHAAGALPVRIIGEDRTISRSAAHLQSYCCSLARTSLDMALEGKLDFLDGTTFVHTCDTMQRLSDIWRLDAGCGEHLDVVLPVRFEGEAAYEYLYDELQSFRARLEKITGKIEDGAIRESIRTYNRNRELLGRLYALRRENPGLVPCDEALWLVTSSSLIEKSEHNELLEKALAGLQAPDDGRGGGGEKVRLFGIGSVMEQWGFLKTLEEIGGTVVDDDFCNGRRYFDAAAPEDDDPVMSLAGRLLDRAICPCKHAVSKDRRSRLTRLVGDSGARGALFFQFKFCEPHAFDYPYVKEGLDGPGVPSLLLEIEQGSVSPEALRTRAEAFIETIRG